MEIVKIPIEQIKINPKNPKLHNDEAILKSVQTFGIRQPIIVTPDGVDNYRIVAGHGRLTAFSTVGQTDIPCIVWDETDENVINAYMVADNSTVIGGGWNDESLSELLQQLDVDTDIDMSVFGFDDDTLNKYLQNLDADLDDSEIEGISETYLKEMNIVLNKETQFDRVEEILKMVSKKENTNNEENPNERGNALYWLCLNYENKD